MAKSADSLTLAFIQLAIVLIALILCFLFFPVKFIKKSPTAWTLLHRYEFVLTISILLSLLVQLVEVSVHLRKLMVHNPLIATDWRSPEHVSNPVVRFIVNPLFALSSITTIFYAGTKYTTMKIPINSSVPTRNKNIKTRDCMNCIYVINICVCIMYTVISVLTDVYSEDIIYPLRIASTMAVSLLLSLFAIIVEFAIFFMLFKGFRNRRSIENGNRTLSKLKYYISYLKQVTSQVMIKMMVLVIVGYLGVCLYLVGELYEHAKWLNYFISMATAVALLSIYSMPTLMRLFHSALKRVHKRNLMNITVPVQSMVTALSSVRNEGYASMPANYTPSGMVESELFFSESDDETETTRSTLFMNMLKWQKNQEL